MEQLQVIREIFLGFGSLITVTLFILVLYLLFFLKYNKNLDGENKMLLKTLAVTIVFVCFLCLIKQLISEYTLLTYPNRFKHIVAGNILQLYLPFQVYILQRSYGYFSKIRDVIILSGGIFFLNVLLLIGSFFIGVEKLIVVQYIIQISIILVIIYQYLTLRIAFKEIFSISNGNVFSLKGDMFLFIITSTIALFLALSLFTGLSYYKTEVLRLIMGLINIILLIKVISYSSSQELSVSQTRQLAALSYLPESDCFNAEKENDLKNRLLSYFETEKPYLNPNLKITEVALYLYSNKTYLSRLINDHYKNNFNQFVNGHRINTAINLFLNDNQMNIHQLCDQSGFGSMATFTMAFRMCVGKSPAEWCKEQKIKAHNDKQKEDN